jgi:hypothetical protein
MSKMKSYISYFIFFRYLHSLSSVDVRTYGVEQRPLDPLDATTPATIIPSYHPLRTYLGATLYTGHSTN